jgi:hypothetical protein
MDADLLFKQLHRKLNEARDTERNAVLRFIDIGNDLLALKQKVGRGRWLNDLRKLGLDDRVARRGNVGRTVSNPEPLTGAGRLIFLHHNWRSMGSGRFVKSDRPARYGRTARSRTLTIPKSLAAEPRKADPGVSMVPIF